jgi:metal-responsive CopG/Arc/MetJ family transcriptional regulator
VISSSYIMRTLVDIPETQLTQLTAIGKAKKVPRAEVIREAIAAYIETQPNPARDAAFGIWKGEEDGLEYQRRIRDEW